jgi:hypothetical protein
MVNFLQTILIVFFGTHSVQEGAKAIKVHPVREPVQANVGHIVGRHRKEGDDLAIAHQRSGARLRATVALQSG